MFAEDKSPCRVVVVDDDPAICCSLKFSLELEGYEVHTYPGSAALLSELELRGVDCLVTTMSAGRRCEKVPTSRAVPHADGCPVRENGLLPGSEILPVSKCRL